MTLSVSSRGVRSIPKSDALNFSIGFFFAFMILGRDAYRGSVEGNDEMRIAKTQEVTYR